MHPDGLADAPPGKLANPSWNGVGSSMTTGASKKTCAGIVEEVETNGWLDCRRYRVEKRRTTVHPSWRNGRADEYMLPAAAAVALNYPPPPPNRAPTLSLDLPY